MTQATTRDYWISPNALHIELNAMGNPDYIQASCVSGAQILVYIKDVISYDAGHNYRRWVLQASPTVFNTHTEKYVYVAIPRNDTQNVATVVFPSELLDIYGKNEKEEQIGDEKYYYIFLQGIITSSGDNGTVQRDWKKDSRVVTGYLSSDEAISAIPYESEWYNYSSVDGIVTFLKDIAMNAGTKFRELFAKTLTIVSGGKIAFENQGEVNGVVNDATSLSSVDKIVTPVYLDNKALSKVHEDIAQKLITFMEGLKVGLDGKKGIDAKGNAVLGDVVVDRVHDLHSTESDRTIIGAQGFDLYMGNDGKSHLYVDYLTARTRMFASSVEIRKVSYSGGTTIFSNAGSQITKVSYIWDAAQEKVIAYKCYAAADDGTTKTMNWWHVGMMALCQTFNVKAGESDNLANRYYWRMVVGVGQEKLDGKLYDYVILSNVKEFQGNLLTIPTYADKTLANEQENKLVWGNVMVEVTMDDGMQSLASLFMEQEGKDVDDNGSKIADRIFYGYDGDEEPDAPAPFDVIVQVGDQIQWTKYGNVIKLSTSTEDSATDNAPAITMYHKLGALHYTGSLDANGNKTVNPYQWKIITTIISPEKVMHNTDNFQLFQGTPDNIIDPITIMYDIVPSVTYYTRHPSTQTTTPTDITFLLRKRIGNKVETLTDAQIYAEYTLLDGSSNTKLLANKALSDIGNIYQITSVKLKSTIKEAGHEDIVVTYDLPVLTDGVKGETGESGTPGYNGLDALEVSIKNAPLVFDTDENGVVNPSAIQVAEIWASRDGENVIEDIKNATIVDSLNFNVGSANATIRKTSECLQITLKGIGIAKENVNGSYVSKTSGYVVVQFDDNNNVFTRQIAFNVNVSRFNSSVIQTAKLYEQKYTEVSNKYNALPEEVRDKESFTEYNSTIKQTAREISLSITEEAAKKRNLLVNSDFARNGGFCITNENQSVIERLGGYDGSNCIHTFTSNSVIYPIVHWEGVNNSCNNIPVVKNTKYTISCWVKTSNTIAHFFVKVFRQSEQTGNSASETTDTILNKEVVLNAANTWQLVSFTFDTTDDMSYASVRLYFQATTNTRIDGYICKPMFEQADSYNGWTLSEEDYDYRGGNMLDNSRYLNIGGNLKAVGDVKTNAKDGCSLSEASVGTGETNTLLRYETVPVTINMDYTLSFWVRSVNDSNKNVKCSINLLDNVKYAECSNGSVSNFTSTTKTDTSAPSSGYVEIENVPTEWTKVWYHFSAQAGSQQQIVAIQVYGANGAGTLQICQPKLEAGVMSTPWTEATEDIANKDALRRTGIDIEKGKITLNADNTIISGDLHLRGVLVENYEDVSATDDKFVICDMKAHKSVTVHAARVLLPMLDELTVKDSLSKSYLINGLAEAGVKLTIAAKYNSYVAKWARTTPALYADNKNFDNIGLMATYHNYATVVFADPRLANVDNYVFKNDSYGSELIPTVFPEGGGGYGATGYEGGVFVCNGRRGRILVLMPGQTLHLTSAIEYVNEKQVLVWYVDNTSDFEPISKVLRFYLDVVHEGASYEHWFQANGGNAFPMEVFGSSGSDYEDAIFATSILNEENLTDTSLHAEWDIL